MDLHNDYDYFFSTYIIFLKKNDPELLKARAKTRPMESWDKIYSSISGLLFIVMYILLRFDAVRYE